MNSTIVLGAKSLARGSRYCRGALRLLALLACFEIAACSLPEAGPTRDDISEAARPAPSGQTRFALIDVSPSIVDKMEKWSAASLRASFGTQRPPHTQTIGIGDSVQIVLWEAAGGGLFSAPITDRLSPGARSAVIPEQVVGNDGAVTVPYAGRIRVAGRTPSDVESSIDEALKGKAIEPQALVTVTKNVANTVSVVGEVTAGARIPLTVRGDRILDVIATAGGIKAPAHDAFITLIRNGRSVRVPLQTILMDPQEDIYVAPGDVITVTREPQTFTAIGATGRNDVIPFDAVGISLGQAIGRAGGLNDQRADPAGVFVIRFEQPAEYDQLGFVRPSMEPTDQVPVIYRLDMRDPNAFFLANRFPIRNKDMLFVSNAAATDVQKVGAIIATFLIPGGTAVGVAAIAKP